MNSTRFLHIIYILELLITNRFLNIDEKTFFIKILIFILFLSFTIILHISEFKTSNYKKRYRNIIQKYETLFEKYVYTLNNNENLKNQVKSFDIPNHIKIHYINFLIKSKHNCPICLSIIKKDENVFLTICGHLFHEDCINHDNNLSDKCPNCRTYIPKNDLSDSDDEISDDETQLILIDN